jgi:hypothetical protein
VGDPPSELHDNDPLKEGDVTHVDGHQQRFLDQLIVINPRINAAPCRHHESAHVTVFRSIVKAGCAAQDVDRVGVPAEQAIRAKAGDPLPRVAL